MSGKGNCYDNAAVETFFKTIKAELLWQRSWRSRREAEIAIFEYIKWLLQSTPTAFSPRLEKPLGIRKKGRLSEQSERHQTVTRPT